MNHLSEWQLIYHPRSGKRVYRHKGTGLITDSLFKIGKVLKKPLVNLAKQAGKKVAEKGINKASDVVVKKAGDKIGAILRKRSKGASEAMKTPSRAKPPQVAAKPTKSRPPVAAKPTKSRAWTRREELMQLNNLLSQL